MKKKETSKEKKNGNKTANKKIQTFIYYKNYNINYQKNEVML